ncbi:MAG: hypothetical protein COB81_08620 [Flavobacteriaceae bacterium]|nr:MAG: hypothetical protein COB81_08620 [Flavobacteriaceae bacterium]
MITLYILAASLLLVIAFLIYLVKKQLKTKQDYNAQNKSLPLALGTKRTQQIMMIFGAISVGLSIGLLTVNSHFNQSYKFFSFALISLPLLYFTFKVRKGTSLKHFAHLQQLLYLSGVCAIGVCFQLITY